MDRQRGVLALRVALHAWSLLLIVALTLLGTPIRSQAQVIGTPSRVADVVYGDVLNIEGELYTVKDVTGHEVELRVTGETQQEERIKVGDKVEARIAADGKVQSIRIQYR